MGDVQLEQCVYVELSLTTGVDPEDVKRILRELGFDDELREQSAKAEFEEPRMITVDALRLHVEPASGDELGEEHVKV